MPNIDDTIPDFDMNPAFNDDYQGGDTKALLTSMVHAVIMDKSGSTPAESPADLLRKVVEIKSAQIIADIRG